MSASTPSERAFPALTLVLPGRWVQVLVRDQDGVEELLALVERAQGPDRTQSLRERLALLRDLGGDQVLVSTTDPASVVVTSWPATTVDGIEGLAAGAEGVAEVERLDHRDGWPLVRLVREAVDGTAATYWLAHPRSGRVLALEVTVDVPDFDHPRWRTLDLLVGDLEWDETEQEGDAGGSTW